MRGSRYSNRELDLVAESTIPASALMEMLEAVPMLTIWPTALVDEKQSRSNAFDGITHVSERPSLLTISVDGQRLFRERLADKRWQDHAVSPDLARTDAVKQSNQLLREHHIRASRRSKRSLCQQLRIGT